MSNNSTQTVAAQRFFDKVAEHFADTRAHVLNSITVPTNDARYHIAYRRDAFSNNRLVLEFAMDACEACPSLQNEDGSDFFDSDTACVVVTDVNATQGSGTGDVAALTRCQHVIRRNSPRALFEAIEPLSRYLSNDAERPFYVSRKKRQDDIKEVHYALGVPFALQGAVEETVDAHDMSDAVPPPHSGLPTWQYVAIGVAALFVVAAVAFGVVAVLKGVCSRTTTALKRTGVVESSVDSDVLQ